MSFHLIRLFDRILGLLLFYALVPLANLLAHHRPHNGDDLRTITILKLHGGGSLLMAMPALQGLRQKYPSAIITLVGTNETKKFSELTAVFDRYALIESSSIGKLVSSGLSALWAARRQDAFLDFEPHSSLAAIFCALSLSATRIGFVTAEHRRRAMSYTVPVFFNLFAPVYVFYEQAVGLLGAEPARVEACRAVLKSPSSGIAPLMQPQHPKPWIFVCAFTSSLSPERMLPVELWIERLKTKFGSTPFTLIVGGGTLDKTAGERFADAIRHVFPETTVINGCGQRSLRESVADIDACDEFWGVDSGPLHIARLLGKPCTSFWGPSNPAFRLRPVAGLAETIHYRAFPCSPCVHVSAESPCGGNNQCMKKLFSEDPAPPITDFA